MADNNTQINDNLGTITNSFNGVMTTVGTTVGVLGGESGGIYGASFNVTNSVITGVVSFEGSPQARADLEKIAVGAGAEILLTGALSSGLTLALGGGLAGAAAAAASPVLIVGAAAISIGLALRGDDVYSLYTEGQKALFQKLLELGNDPEIQKSLSPEEKQRLREMGFIPFDPNDPENYNPNNPGGGGTSPGETSPGGTTPGGETSPGGGGTSPGGTTPGGGTSPNGHPLPYNPAVPQPHDPLVLDLNQDGKISTIALSDSQVYFDLTGDGVKERVGWIAPEDGLLVYDKNMNGKIDGISEVFGKDGLSGFAELRAVADSNYDNVIDRRDALFSQLKVWQDLNQDGISQSNELKSLTQAGVKNIELNVIGTNINLNGNILSEAGRYGDTAGERELAADIQLLATERVNSSNTSSTYEIDPITETLPQMRGYGYIDNSFKAYNLDPKLKELALLFMNDKESASANFGEFILRWSGFYDMAKSKGISEEQFSPHLYEVPSIKLWILERFVGSKKDGWRSEYHLIENTNGGYHTQDFGNEAYIHEHFNLLMERYEAMFAIQAYYGDVFSDTHYDYANSFYFINQEFQRKAA